MPMNIDDEVFGIKDAAKLLHMSADNLYRECQAEEIEYTRIGRGKGTYLFTRRTLNDYLARRTVKVKPTRRPNGRSREVELEVVADDGVGARN